MRTANNLSDALAYAVEVNLATLDDLLLLKSSSKFSVLRQTTICKTMLVDLTRLADTGEVNWCFVGSQSSQYPRLHELLNNTRTEPEGASGAIDRYVKEHYTKG